MLAFLMDDLRKDCIYKQKIVLSGVCVFFNIGAADEGIASTNL